MLICDGCHAEAKCGDTHPVSFSLLASCVVCGDEGMCTECDSSENKFLDSREVQLDVLTRDEPIQGGSISEALIRAASLEKKPR